TLPLEQQLKLNYPCTVLARWKKFHTPPKPPRPRERPSDPVMMLVLSAMTDAEWAEALTYFLGLDKFVRLLVGDPKGGPCLPDDWRTKLETRAGEQAIRRLRQRHPNKRIGKLKLVHDAGAETSH